MTDFDEQNVDTNADGNEPTAEDFRDLRYKARQLPKVERKLSETAEENTTLRRELALLKAGLDLSPKQTAALIAAHGDAEWTRDSLRETASELRFITADESDADKQQRDAALQGQERLATAHAGAPAPTPPSNIQEAIRQAEASGDAQRAMSLKAQHVAALMFSGQTVPFS